MLYTTQYFGCYHHPEGSEYCSFDVICDMSVSCFLPFGSPKNWWLIVHHHFTLLKNESLIWRNNEITCFFDHHKKNMNSGRTPRISIHFWRKRIHNKSSPVTAGSWKIGRSGTTERPQLCACLPVISCCGKAPRCYRTLGATACHGGWP